MHVFDCENVSPSFIHVDSTSYPLTLLDLEDMCRGFGGYNSGDLVNDLLDVSGVREPGGAQLRELNAEAGVGGDVDVWWEGGG